MKQFPDGNNKFPLEDKSSSYAGSPPTADNFNGVTAELVNLVKKAELPLDPMSGKLTGSDNKPLMESESNKQIYQAIDKMGQDDYLRTMNVINLLAQHTIGQGRINGLEVTKTTPLKVSIAAGYGISPLGQQIVLEHPIEIDLSNTTQTIEIGLRYFIQEPNYVIGDIDIQYKAQEIIEPVFGVTLADNILPIAKVIIDSSGISTITMTALYKTKQDLKDFKRSFPIGYQYTQYADENTKLFNNQKSPTAMFGSFGNWRIIYQSKSTFFRTEGTEATSQRGDDGIQKDALQTHIHQTYIGAHSHSVVMGSHSHSVYSGVGYTSGYSNPVGFNGNESRGNRTTANPVNLGTKYSNTVDYGTKNSGNPYGSDVRAASETRVKNALIRIYELVSYKEFY